ncbi:MAG: sensor domain-containing diguanylate cyclase [Wenzhouxiangellaceae bacterium]|nr:sensor domain-containing diguanylate cyclase [Wenzhouxiangellaceae bacterium]
MHTSPPARDPPGQESPEDLRLKAERFDRLAHSVPALLYDYVIEADGTARCLYCSAYSKSLFGLDPDVIERDMNTLFALIHPDDRDRFHREDRRANRTGTQFLIELRVALASGEEKWLRISSRPNPANNDGPAIWSGYMIDISDTKRMETLLQERATHDFLTGLANRQLFQECFGIELERARRYRQPAAVLLMDLDHFKTLNDRLGHDAGDRVLKAFSDLVQAQLRAVDTLARWGGEEFAVLLPETGLEKACEVAERIRSGVEQHRIECHDQAVTITVSIGATELDESDDRVETVMRRADEALYQAKRTGRNSVIGN